MDGSSVAMDGVPRSFAFGEESWVLSPVTIEDYCEVERRIVAMQPHPLEEVRPYLSGMDESHARTLLEIAYKDTMALRRATPQQVAEYLRTGDGFVLLVWLSVRKTQPTISEKAVASVVRSMTATQLVSLRDAIDDASGTPKN